MANAKSRKKVTKHKTRARAKNTLPVTRTRKTAESVAVAAGQPSTALKTALNVLNGKLDMLTTHVKGIESIVVSLQSVAPVETGAPTVNAGGSDLFSEAPAATDGNGQTTITKEEVSLVLNEVLAKHGATAIQEILADHGAKKLSDLTPANYPNVIAAATKWDVQGQEQSAGLDFLS